MQISNAGRKASLTEYRGHRLIFCTITFCRISQGSNMISHRTSRRGHSRSSQIGGHVPNLKELHAASHPLERALRSSLVRWHLPRGDWPVSSDRTSTANGKASSRAPYFTCPNLSTPPQPSDILRQRAADLAGSVYGLSLSGATVSVRNGSWYPFPFFHGQWPASGLSAPRAQHPASTQGWLKFSRQPKASKNGFTSLIGREWVAEVGHHWQSSAGLSARLDSFRRSPEITSSLAQPLDHGQISMLAAQEALAAVPSAADTACTTPKLVCSGNGRRRPALFGQPRFA